MRHALLVGVLLLGCGESSAVDDAPDLELLDFARLEAGLDATPPADRAVTADADPDAQGEDATWVDADRDAAEADAAVNDATPDAVWDAEPIDALPIEDEGVIDAGPDPGWGPCSVRGTPGECLPTAECDDGRVSTRGFCPGPAEIQCCAGVACVDGSGQPGECFSTALCDQRGRTRLPWLCPGDDTVQCCLDPPE